MKNSKNSDKDPDEEYFSLTVYGDDVTKTINAKGYFGWKIENDPRKKTKAGELKDPFFMHKFGLNFSRHQDFPYHDRAVELERKYEKAEHDKEEYYPLDILNVLGLFLLAIVPGIIYLVVRSGKKKRIDLANQELAAQQKSYLVEAQKILSTNKKNFLLVNNDETMEIPTFSVNKPLYPRNKNETPVAPESPKIPPLPNEKTTRSNSLGNSPSRRG